MPTKADIRRRLLARRRELDTDDVLENSEAASERVAGLQAFHDASVILAYLPIDKEVDLRPLLDNWLHAGREILVPVRANPGERPFRFEWSHFARADTPARAVTPPHRAPVLVPGIAFCARGYRIGYGGGFYDAFLLRHRGFGVGVAYDFQVHATLPHEPHDVPVDIIVTESRIIECRAAGQA